MFNTANISSPDILREKSRIPLPERTEAFDPVEFFQNRQRLVVWGDFRNLILPAAKTVRSVPAIEIASFDLIRKANNNNTEIRQELPEDHVFEASELCYLAGMIERQKNGEDGDLLTNGHTNIAYVYGVLSSGVFAVFVYWLADDRRWYVSAYRLGGCRWDAGCRILSRNCPSVA